MLSPESFVLALNTARTQLIALGTDPRILPDSELTLADRIQITVLDIIDMAFISNGMQPPGHE